MRERTAIDTIIGYFYQFDYAIYKLLNLNNEDEFITVEGVEDVDISTATEETAIQCKYYSKTEYNHSVIAKPIRLMLNHYKEVKDGNKSSVNYYLYGFYSSGQDKLGLPINKDSLKKYFLTYTKDKVRHIYHDELGLNDQDLDDFISKLTININAISYEGQVEQIIDLLKEKFDCSEFTAEHFYYNSALKVIKDIATKLDISERVITKKEFIKLINNKQLLFNEWFLAYRGEKEYFATIRKEYFTSLNISPFERFFLIEVDEANYKRSELKNLIFLISKKWTNISKRQTSPYCPYIYIHNIDINELLEIKRELYNEGFKFIDGFDYNGALFSMKSIVQTAKFENGIRIKILDELEYLHLTLNEVSKTREVFQFYMKNPYVNIENKSIKSVKIQVKNFKYVKEVI
ncbi:MAG: DUF4297 family anti-phage-associated protein [Clostridium sp.]|uniref:DUF4297 family anti-phage-associated protein n=1 Tax=Clostridium sp. TaxID=1506 RepID=UPI003071C058